MSGKLDKSLDEILSTRRQARRSSQRRPAQKASNGNTSAPIGGVRKSTRQTKPTSKAIPTKPAGGAGEGKIIVSGLVSCYTLVYYSSVKGVQIC